MLQLLAERLRKLSHSGFFADSLERYVNGLCDSVRTLEDRLLEANADIPLIAEVASSIWQATQFLTGTTSNRVPYEITFLLKAVLLDWGLGDCIVTTSLNQSPDFYCESAGSAPDSLIKQLKMPNPALSGHLVQMGVPEIFQHMPLLCSPLYHEVGHYIEEHERLISSLLVKQRDIGLLVSAMPDLAVFETDRESVAKAWLIEHLCDLIAASYVGECVSDYIIQWDINPLPQPSHPSAESRQKLTKAFLANEDDALLNMLRTAISDAGLEGALKLRFEMPDVEGAFQDVRPVELTSIEHLHGLLPAADAFLKRLASSPEDFASTNIGRVARRRQSHLVNDLIEKSIRSFMIQKVWNESLDAKTVA